MIVPSDEQLQPLIERAIAAAKERGIKELDRELAELQDEDRQREKTVNGR